MKNTALALLGLCFMGMTAIAQVVITQYPPNSNPSEYYDIYKICPDQPYVIEQCAHWGSSSSLQQATWIVTYFCTGPANIQVNAHSCNNPDTSYVIFSGIIGVGQTQYVTIPPLSTPTDDPSDPGPQCDKPCCGMPVWSVSDYTSLWLHDQPIGYQPAAGPAVNLKLEFKQRETTAGYDANTFSVGKRWNFSWFSCVSLDTSGYPRVHFPTGQERSFITSQDYLTNTRLSGDTNGGFTVLYPDGSKDVYGFIFTNSSGTFLKALRTENWNAISQKTTFYYTNYNAGPVVRLLCVVDGDGRTNKINYVASNAYSTNLIASVVDPFNRTNTLQYDTSGHLTNITDVAGIASSLTYDTSDRVNGLTTPYGTTSFQVTEDRNNPDSADNRSVLITQPDGGHQLYLSRDAALGVPSSYTDVPNTLPFTNTFDVSDLNFRNVYYWGPRQYQNLSTTNIYSFNANDFNRARLRHFLFSATGVAGRTLSFERDPSPDAAGNIEGQKTWYDYAGKTNTEFEATQVGPLFVAQVLPDGTTTFSRMDRNSIGAVTTNISTYSTGSGIALRTNVYTYDANGVDQFTSIDATGVQVSSNSYSALHEVLTSFNALNEKTIYTYDSAEQVTSIARPTGLITTNIYDTNNLLTMTYDYAIVGGSTAYYRTNSFTYTNDLVYSHTDERGLTTLNTWDNLQRLRRVDFPDGTFVTNTYNNLDLTLVADRMGFTTSYVYDSMRRKIAETNAIGAYIVYNYCTCGSLDSIVDVLTNTTSFTYDNVGRLIETDYPDHYSVYNNYDLLGHLANVTDTAGANLTNYYNNQGLQIASSNTFGRLSSAVYDILDRATNNVDGNGVSISTTYDVLGRILTRTYPDTGIENFGYTFGVATQTGYTNQLQQPTLYGYDPLGRKLAETNANLEITRFAYSPASDLLTLTDAKNQTTTWVYDQYGRVTNKFDALNNLVFLYGYDADSRLTNRWTPAKGATTYKYDAAGNLTNITYPVSSAISMAYDLLNRLTNMVDAVGTTRYSYDAASQLLSEDGPWTDDAVSFSYANRLRTRLSLQAPNASPWTEGFGYDSARRVTTVTSPAGAFSYSYPSGIQNLASRLLLPNGAYITNTYDGNARLISTRLLNSSGALLNSHQYIYNQGNQRTQQVFTASDYVNYTYDPAGQLKTATGKEAGGVTNRLHEQFGYAYDAAGNLNWKTNNALLEAFSVNALNELTTESNSGTLTVAGTTTSVATNVTVNGLIAALYTDATFDKEGFSFTNGLNTFTATAKDSLARTSSNTVSCTLTNGLFSYDPNGNLLSDGTRTFAYDDENELTSVWVTNAWRSDFIYDGKMRRRIRREYTWSSGSWLQTNEVHYVYDGSLVVQERDGYNFPQISYTRGRDLSGSLQRMGGIGTLLARTDDRSLAVGDPKAHAYYHADGNGNITCLINAFQLSVARYFFDPFGTILSQSGSLADGNVYRYSSREIHCNSGLCCYAYRCYDPTIQRWLTRDPVGLGGGFNPYSFVGNRTTSSVDPLGLCCGSFIVRNKAQIPIPDDRLQASGGKKYLSGFDVQYVPCDPCPCSKDKIRLVQAIKSSGGTGERPHFDYSNDQLTSNRNGTDTSLPPYTGWGGDEGALSFQDAPNNPRKLYGETTFTMEVCALCKDGKDTVLGCMTFTFGDVVRKPTVLGGKARPNGDGVGVGCSAPGNLWNDAVKDWNGVRNH